MAQEWLREIGQYAWENTRPLAYAWLAMQAVLLVNGWYTRRIERRQRDWRALRIQRSTKRVKRCSCTHELLVKEPPCPLHSRGRLVRPVAFSA
jgi:hypothetical protein